jgi:hypothetical protein
MTGVRVHYRGGPETRQWREDADGDRRRGPYLSQEGCSYGTRSNSNQETGAGAARWPAGHPIRRNQNYCRKSSSFSVLR